MTISLGHEALMMAKADTHALLHNQDSREIALKVGVAACLVEPLHGLLELSICHA